MTKQQDLAYSYFGGDALYEPITLFDAVFIAQDWHGGQSSALYSLASTGEIHGRDHLEALQAECNAISTQGIDSGGGYEVGELRAFLNDPAMAKAFGIED